MRTFMRIRLKIAMSALQDGSPELAGGGETVELIEESPTKIPTHTIPQSVQSTEDLNTPPDYNNIEKILSCVKLVRTKYVIVDSSTFDCVIQLLAAVADEYPTLREVITTSTNETLKLVTTYLESADVTAFSLQRASFVKTYFKERLRRHNLDIKAEYRISLNDNIVEYTKNVSVLKSDNSKMFKSNFKGLEKVLEVYDQVFRVQCSKCSRLCHVVYYYNSLVFVELSCTDSFHSPKRCQLGDIQKLLCLKVNYRLSSVIAPSQDGGDEVFYRRTDGMWLLLGKLFHPIKKYPESTIVIPYAALYVPEEEST